MWVSHTKGSSALVGGLGNPTVTASQFFMGTQSEKHETSCYRNIKKWIRLHSAIDRQNNLLVFT